MIRPPPPLEFFGHLKWLDGRPLLETIEPYRRKIFAEALFTFGADGFPLYNRVLCGRAKKNYKTADLTLAALYRFLAWPSPAGNDVFIIANDEEQAGDDLALAKKLVAANPELAAEVKIYERELARRDGGGRVTILPAQDVIGLHGKTYLFLGFDEIHGYRNYDVLEALSPDPTRRDTLTWITSYAGIRHAPGIPLFDLMRLGKTGDDPRMFFSWYGGDFTTDAALAADDIAPELRANPSIAAWGNDTYLDDQRRRLPTHKFRRLHLNLPGAPDGAAFDADALIDAIVPGRKKVPPRAGCHYHAFVDMSGGSADDAVLGIAHAEDGRVVVDLLISQTGAPPFNPRAAVRKFAEAMREYGVHRVTGDRFAGETFRQDFQEQGIFYDVSERTRSQIYEAFEPLLNAARAELPDISKMQEQFSTLVVKASGHIDHLTGDHDDWANACAGAVVLAAGESGPALIRSADLMTPEKAGTEIGFVKAFYATMWIGIDGTAAWVIFAMGTEREPLIIADCDVQPWRGGMLDDIMVRLDQFCEAARERNAQCRERGVGAWWWGPEQLVEAAQESMFRAFEPRLTRPDARLRRFGCEAIDAAYLSDPAKLALNASAHTSAGKVKLGPAAAERSRGAPLLGALAIRPGERVEGDPLRLAVLVGVAIALDAEPSHAAPMIPAARVAW